MLEKMRLNMYEKLEKKKNRILYGKIKKIRKIKKIEIYRMLCKN